MSFATNIAYLSGTFVDVNDVCKITFRCKSGTLFLSASIEHIPCTGDGVWNNLWPFSWSLILKGQFNREHGYPNCQCQPPPLSTDSSTTRHILSGMFRSCSRFWRNFPAQLKRSKCSRFSPDLSPMERGPWYAGLKQTSVAMSGDHIIRSLPTRTNNKSAHTHRTGPKGWSPRAASPANASP